MKYSFFSLSLPECTPAEAAKLIKEAGYDGVEWRCAPQPDVLPVVPNPWSSNRATIDTKKWKEVISEFRKVTDDHGLEISNLGTSCRVADMDHVKTVIEIAKAIKCPRFRVNASLYDGKRHHSELFKEAKDGYAKVAELAKAAGVQAMIELHMDCIAPSASMALRLIEGLDPKYIGIIYDPGNMVIEGFERWKMSCEMIGAYLVFCHAKNTQFRPTGTSKSGAVKWGWEPCEMNTGLVDWTEVFQALKAVGYNGWVSNEDFYFKQGTSLERIRFGLQHLKACESLA
jgi:sugar phosphate isomerase/epimerase